MKTTLAQRMMVLGTSLLMAQPLFASSQACKDLIDKKVGAFVQLLSEDPDAVGSMTEIKNRGECTGSEEIAGYAKQSLSARLQGQVVKVERKAYPQAIAYKISVKTENSTRVILVAMNPELMTIQLSKPLF